MGRREGERLEVRDRYSSGWFCFASGCFCLTVRLTHTRSLPQPAHQLTNVKYHNLAMNFLCKGRVRERRRGAKEGSVSGKG